VPENKRGSGGEASEAPDDLSKAMADAVRAVEARERGASGDLPAPEDEATTDDMPSDAPQASAKPDKPEGKSANDAVTEALIKAKHELESVLEQTQTEAKSLRDKWLRAAADLENYKKRAQKERDEVVKFGNERLLKDFLPVIDDLDRVVSTSGVTSSEQQAQALIEGTKLVLKKFFDQLEKHGVVTFKSEGETFDPNLHEAVQQVHSDLPAGKVVTQLQRGYQLSGRLLRPALVTVSLGPAKPADDGGKKESDG
jgi:molecular chaperone GrpE